MHFWSSFPSWRACRLFPKLVRLPLSVAAFLFDYCREFIRIEIHLVRKASNVIFFIDLLTNAVSRAKWLDFSLQFLFRIVLSWLWQTKKKNRIDRDSVIIDYSGRWSSSSIIGNILCSPYAFSPSSSSVFFLFANSIVLRTVPLSVAGGTPASSFVVDEPIDGLIHELCRAFCSLLCTHQKREGGWRGFGRKHI